MRFSTVFPSALAGFAALSAAAPTGNMAEADDVTAIPANKRAEDVSNNEQQNQNDDYFVNPASPAAQPGYDAGAGAGAPGFGPRPGYAQGVAPYGGFAKRDENSVEYFVNPNHGRPGYAPGTAPYPEYAPGTAPYPEVAKREENANNANDYFVNPGYGHTQGYGQGYGRPGFAPGTAPYPEYAPGTAPYPEVTKRDENSVEYFVNPNYGQPGYGHAQGYGRPGYAPGTAPYPEYAPGTAPYPEFSKRDENANEANDYFVPGPAAPATGYNRPGFAPGTAPYPEYAPGTAPYPEFVKRGDVSLTNEEHDGNHIVAPYLDEHREPPFYVTVSHVGKRDENANDYFVPGPAAPATGYNGPSYNTPGYGHPNAGYFPGAGPYPGIAKRDNDASDFYVPSASGPFPGQGRPGYARPGFAPGTAPYPEYAPGTAPYPEVTKRDENANDYFVPGPAAPATGYNGQGYGAPGFGAPGFGAPRFGNAGLPGAAGPYPQYA